MIIKYRSFYIVISIYFGSVPKNKSGHYYSRTFSYIEEGYKITNRIFSEKNKISTIFFLIISPDDKTNF